MLNTLIAKIIQILKLIPFLINYITKYTLKKSIEQNVEKKFDMEEEWGQFCDISLPISIEAHPKGATH